MCLDASVRPQDGLRLRRLRVRSTERLRANEGVGSCKTCPRDWMIGSLPALLIVGSRCLSSPHPVNIIDVMRAIHLDSPHITC